MELVEFEIRLLLYYGRFVTAAKKWLITDPAVDSSLFL
jgi:hypothetical protein